MRLVLIAFALCLAPAAASAQVLFGQSAQAQESAPGRESVIRVTTNFQSLATPHATLGQSQSPTPADQPGQEAVRRELYELAAGECAILREIYKAECRLTNVTVIQQPGANVWPPRSMMATAVYELRGSSR